MDKQNKNYKLELENLQNNFAVLKMQRNNEKLDIEKKYENQKLSMNLNYKNDSENSERLFLQNTQANENNFKYNMEKLQIERERELKKLDMFKDLMNNAMMTQNPAFMQMMMNQITPKPQEEQTNICAGPLPNMTKFQ